MLSRIINALRYAPAAVAGFVQAAIALVIGLGLHLTAGQAGSIEAAVAAGIALIVAVQVQQGGGAPAAITGLLTAIGTLLIAFRVPHVTSGVVSAANALVVAVLAMVLHVVVVPKAPNPGATPLSRSLRAPMTR